MMPDETRSADYTVEELMISVLSRQFDSTDQVCNGMASFIPVSAIMLARMTHAPDLTWLAGAGGLDPYDSVVPDSTLESALWSSAVMYVEQYQLFWDLAMRGKWLQKFCVGAAQIDRFGNANNSVIGADYDAPRVRLPGTAGLGDMGSIGKRLFFWSTRHTPRTFVERVDFIGCAGWLDGGDSRRAAGLQGGPELVITDLAVMDFDEIDHRMRLRSVHPGIQVSDVVAATGFDLVIPDDVPQTQIPSATDVRLIREVIDPHRTRVR